MNNKKEKLYLKPRKFKPFDKNEYSIRRDEVFKIVFGSNKRKKYLKKFLESILHIQIKDIVIQNEVTMDKIYADNKGLRLDLLAEIEGNEFIDIEFQNQNCYNIINRGDMYGSVLFHTSLMEGENYNEPHKVVVIWILGFDEFKDGPYHDESRIIRKSNGEVLSDNITYHYIQLPKFIEEGRKINTPEEQWLAYISCQLSQNELEVLFKMNKDIKEVNEIVEKVLSSKDIQRELMYRELDANLEYLKKQKAFEDGIEQGIEQGKQAGEKQKQLEIAKNMKIKNKLIEEIMEFTGLTKEEIEKL
jgi:predicted transposase/invertase (TIGR01784 family)